MTTLSARTRAPARPAERVSRQPGVRFGLANAALACSLCLAAAVGLGAGATAGVAVLVSALCGVALSRHATAGLAVTAWAWWTGFSENSYGQLTLAPADLVRLAVFVVVAVVAATLLRVARRRVRSTASRGAPRGARGAAD
jgi:hypothetical protein